LTLTFQILIIVLGLETSY